MALQQAVRRISVETRGKGLTEVTRTIAGFVAAQSFATGLVTLFCRHTSASLLIQENADPDVRTDLLRFFEDLAPEDGPYIHASEGADDMPAHLRAVLTGAQLSVPILDGGLALGTWQGIYLFEHRRAPHRREIVVHALGE